MSKTAYNIQLKGYVGGADSDLKAVDKTLAENTGKPVNVLIDSLGGSLSTGLSISAAFKQHGNVSGHFVGLNASAATIASLGAAHISIDAGAMYLVHKCSMAFFEWGRLNADQFATLIADCEKVKADLDASFTPSRAKDLFAEKSSAAWKDVQQAEALCDFAPNKVRISYRSSTKSLCSAKNRRHKVRNFASLISARLATLLGVNFYEDLAECHSKHRVGAVFTLSGEPPKERNIIIFDDFVTTGATMISMRELLQPLGYNLVFFTGINNNL